MDIEIRAQVIGGHGRALQVPARAAVAPRGRPAGLARLRGLPQGKVLGATLGGILAFALLHFLYLVAGQRTVIRSFGLGPGGDIEVDGAVGGVGKAGVDKPLHIVDHLGDKAGRARLYRRRDDAQGVIGLSELALIRRHPLPPGAIILGRLGEDLVINIGDVAHQGYVIALGEQPAAQDVEGDAGAQVPDVRLGLRGGAAQIDGSVAGANRLEIALAAGGCVINAQSTHATQSN